MSRTRTVSRRCESFRDYVTWRVPWTIYRKLRRCAACRPCDKACACDTTAGRWSFCHIFCICTASLPSAAVCASSENTWSWTSYCKYHTPTVCPRGSSSVVSHVAPESKAREKVCIVIELATSITNKCAEVSSLSWISFRMWDTCTQRRHLWLQFGRL